MSSFTRTILAGAIINATIPCDERTPEQQICVELWWESTGDDNATRVPNFDVDLVRLNRQPFTGRQR